MKQWGDETPLTISELLPDRNRPVIDAAVAVTKGTGTVSGLRRALRGSGYLQQTEVK